MGEIAGEGGSSLCLWGLYRGRPASVSSLRVLWGDVTLQPGVGMSAGLSCRSEEALGLGNTGHVATCTFLPVKMLRFPTWQGCAGDPRGCLTQDLLPSHPYLGRPTC